MEDKEITRGEDIGCLGIIELVGIILLALRWTGLINWSWWIVLAPFYVPAGILILSFIVYLIEEKTRK